MSAREKRITSLMASRKLSRASAKACVDAFDKAREHEKAAERCSHPANKVMHLRKAENLKRVASDLFFGVAK